MSRDSRLKNKPNLHENCVVEEKIGSKRQAKINLKIVKETERKRKPKYWVYDVLLKATYYCATIEQLKQNIDRLLVENPNKILKFSPNLKKNEIKRIYNPIN